MVLDTSALMAVLFDERERDRFIELLADAVDPLISAATLLEASIVVQAKTGADGVADLDELLAAAGVRCVALDSTQAYLARDAFARYGKGRAPAGLNFGDCCSYALARATNRLCSSRAATSARPTEGPRSIDTHTRCDRQPSVPVSKALDVNVLRYASDADSPLHTAALRVLKDWRKGRSA